MAIGGSMQVKCNDCDWQGEQSELVTGYYSNPHSPDDVVPEPVCPVCGNQSTEEVCNDTQFLP